ncbi:MAG: leucine-rich repeat protein [Muribaculaceae bacterium]|nr:leucine-rich repeat protein [Muribaculaceae bacterium]
MKKKLLTMLFAVLITLPAFTAAAFEVGNLAFETMTQSGITMVICTGLSAAGKTANSNGTIGTITIPSGVSYGSNNYRVWSIAESAFADTKITGVRILWGIYAINNNAFKNCTQMTFAFLASSVNYLGTDAFWGCSKLKSVYWCSFGLPAGVMSTSFPSNSDMTLYINYEQTNSINDIKASTFGSRFADVAFNNSGASDMVVGGTDYGYGLTIGTYDTKDYGVARDATVTYFKNTVTSITGRTQSSSSNQDYNGVYYKWTKIGMYALAANNTVQTIDLTSAINLTTINNYAFYKSTALTKLTLPKSLLGIYSSSVEGCTALTEFAVHSDNSVYSAYDGCLYNKNKSALWTVPEGKEGTVSFPSTLVTVGSWAFYKCKKVTSAWLPYGVKTINNGAFYAASNLGIVRIPSSVTSLSNDRVFNGVNSTCFILCNMGNPPSVTASSYFGTNSSMSLYVPYGKNSTYQNAGWTGFKNVNYNDEQAYDLSYYSNNNNLCYTITSTAACTVNGSNYDGRAKLVCYGLTGYYGDEVTTITVPASISFGGKTYAVTKIGEDAFNRRYNYTVAGCANVDTIGEYAFQGQPITSYAFTHNLKRIESLAFESAGLTGTVHIPFGVTYVGPGSFGTGKYSRIIIPGSVTHLAGNFCKNTTTLTELILNKNSSSYYNSSSWDLGSVPGTCYIRVPMGVVNQYKLNSKLNSRASYITGGAYDYIYGTNYTGRYNISITSTAQTTYNGKTYAGTAKYVYHPNIKASSNTYDYGWSINEEDATVSSDKRQYLMTEIGDSLLAGVTNFGIGDIPKTITRIGHDAFFKATGCTKTDLTLPDGLTYIGDYAFNSSNLSGEIKIPESVNFIGKYALYNMPNLHSIYFKVSKPTTLSSYAWGINNANDFTVWVPNKYAHNYLATAKGWGTGYGDASSKVAVWIKSLVTTMMFSSEVPTDLQGTDIDAYYASAYDKNNSTAQVTLSKANLAPGNTGLLLVNLTVNKEYRIKRPSGNVMSPMTNYFIAASLNNGNNVDVYNQTVGYYWDPNASTPHFVKPTGSYTITPGSAYLKLSSSEAGSIKDVYTNLWPNSGLLGDLDDSKFIDVEDVNAAINIILKKKTVADYPGNGDMDGNGFIDVEDVNAMINIILKL